MGISGNACAAWPVLLWRFPHVIWWETSPSNMDVHGTGLLRQHAPWFTHRHRQSCRVRGKGRGRVWLRATGGSIALWGALAVLNELRPRKPKTHCLSKAPIWGAILSISALMLKSWRFRGRPLQKWRRQGLRRGWSTSISIPKNFANLSRHTRWRRCRSFWLQV